MLDSEILSLRILSLRIDHVSWFGIAIDAFALPSSQGLKNQASDHAGQPHPHPNPHSSDVDSI